MKDFAKALLSNTYTELDPNQEKFFQAWKKMHNVPFKDEALPDYDMRGYFKDVVLKGDNKTGIDPTDKQLHYPDTYKEPTHESFSSESKYSTPDMDQKEWFGNLLINLTKGKVAKNPYRK